MRGAEQHGLRFQRHARLAVLQHARDHVARLIRLVAHRDQQRTRGRFASRPEIFGEALGRQRDHGIRRRQDRLRRTVVLLERDDARLAREVPGEVQNVAHGRGAERIDRLRVVADHREPAPVGLERKQDRGLQPVGVLIFVDQHVVEARADLGGEIALGQHVRQIEQQIVVIEHVLALLRLDIGGEQSLQFGRPVGAPRKRAAQHLLRAALRQFTTRE